VADRQLLFSLEAAAELQCKALYDDDGYDAVHGVVSASVQAQASA